MGKLISFLKQNRHDPFLIGYYECDMALAYFPKNELEKILPKGASIPSDEIMGKKFPGIRKIEGMHPFLFLASTGSGFHPLCLPDYDSPGFEEIVIHFPVIYTHEDEEQICSYMPVIYLDYLFGVITGNCYLKLRKEWHPKMIIEKTNEEKRYIVKDIIDINFNRTSDNNVQELDPFFVQIFELPTMTVSYLNKPYFFNMRMFSISTILKTTPTYEWNYNGSVIRNNEYTYGNYSEFNFTVSKVMKYNDYFHPNG